MTKKNKVFRILKYVCSGLWWLGMIVGAILIFSFLGAHFKGEVPRIGNYSVMNIISESMEPTIEKGTYILVKHTDPKDVKKGDIICFYSTDPMIYGRPNTHRVVEEPTEVEGKMLFTTKGDSNLAEDAYHAEGDRLIGVWVKNLSFMTVFLAFLSENFIWLFASLMLVNIVIIFGSMFVKAKGQESGAATDSSKNKKEE